MRGCEGAGVLHAVGRCSVGAVKVRVCYRL